MTHVLIATDGSEQSLKAARYLRSLLDPASLEHVSVIAVVRPLAAVPFASDFGEEAHAAHQQAEDPAGHAALTQPGRAPLLRHLGQVALVTLARVLALALARGHPTSLWLSSQCDGCDRPRAQSRQGPPRSRRPGVASLTGCAS